MLMSFLENAPHLRCRQDLGRQRFRILFNTPLSLEFESNSEGFTKSLLSKRMNEDVAKFYTSVLNLTN